MAGILMKAQDQREIESICEEIWNLTRSALSLEYPFLQEFFAGYQLFPQWERQSVGTDGKRIYFHPGYLMERYAACPENVEQMFLHMVGHSLFLHPLRGGMNGGEKEGKVRIPEEIRGRIWNLACDLAVKNLHLFDKERSGERKEKEIRPEKIELRLFMEWRSGSLTEEGLTEQEKSCQADDHFWWNRTEEEELLKRVEVQWNRMDTAQGSGFGAFSDSMGSRPGDRSERISVRKKKKQDFRLFLKRFAVSGEEMETDPESFDYIPYLYGMERYGNMPLIEELEYREVHKIEELVIAIDTSGSCSADMVRRFMEETYGILSDCQNFFRKMNVYLIQCDCFIQNVVHIESEEAWRAYLDDLTIEGRSGTDFRPVFQYVEELRRKKELKNLKGLLYFTDGDGIYPRKAPDYETAFIFYREKACHQQVPSWAVRLTMEDEGDA